jgi:hypothetical protein
MQSINKFTGRGSYVRKGKTKDKNTLVPEPARYADDVVNQPLPSSGTVDKVVKPYRDGRGAKWPKAWDGVLVPADQVGNLDPRKSVADIVYADIKTTRTDGAPVLTDNQAFGAKRYPVSVIHYVWPSGSPVPVSATVKKGPSRASKSMPRLMTAARRAEYVQNMAAAGVSALKKRKLH